jgi:hypothetical protein
MRLTAIILILILTSCQHNSKKITKEYDGSTITATLIDGKFNGVVKQTIHDKDNWLKSITTEWRNGVIKKIVVTDRENVKHDMQYFERIGNDKNEVTVFYVDKNDSKFKTLPFDADFLDFCIENAFLSTYSLSNFDSIIDIYNIPENYYRAVSSPLPIRIENNAIKVIDNGYKTDSLFVTLHWYIGKSETELKIEINKNVW